MELKFTSGWMAGPSQVPLIAPFMELKSNGDYYKEKLWKAFNRTIYGSEIMIELH